MSKTMLSILISLVVLVICGFVGFSLYNSTLTQSKIEGSKIQSRAVSSSAITSNSNSANTLSQSNTILKSGIFTTLDPAHYAKGSVQATQIGTNVRIDFSQDFQTNPDGPDLYVWLVKPQEIKNIALGGVNTDKNSYLDLGAIQSKSSKQSYQVTTEEFNSYNYAIVIWCRAFGVQFSNAVLN